MKIFSYLYDKTVAWSANERAPLFLAGVSFAESSFFPIPPDVMLISMGLAKPQSAWRYALLATFFSVIGGILGYSIGLLAIDVLKPYIMASSYAASYEKVVQLFLAGGVWFVIVAGFTPFPYKIFTISAGAMQLPFVPFVIGSIIGRGLRFFLVSGLLYFFGDKLNNHLRKYIETIGWVFLIIFAIVYFYFKWLR